MNSLDKQIAIVTAQLQAKQQELRDLLFLQTAQPNLFGMIPAAAPKHNYFGIDIHIDNFEAQGNEVHVLGENDPVLFASSKQAEDFANAVGVMLKLRTQRGVCAVSATTHRRFTAVLNKSFDGLQIFSTTCAATVVPAFMTEERLLEAIKTVGEKEVIAALRTLGGYEPKATATKEMVRRKRKARHTKPAEAQTNLANLSLVPQPQAQASNSNIKFQ